MNLIMWRLLLQKIFSKILSFTITFLGITIISFWVIHLAPGSPTDLQTTLNPKASSEARERLLKLYGLDKPLHVQYVEWLKRVIHFDFGNSLSGDHRPVWEKIKERLPLTLTLNAVSLFLVFILAIPIGILSAVYVNSWFDKLMTVFVFIGFSIPSFWLALLLILGLSIWLPIFPISGLTSLGFESFTFWEKCLDLARHLALPVFVFTLTGLAGFSRYMRASMLEILGQDFILLARAKGLPYWRVVLKHAGKNALLPIITILGLSVPGLIGGSVIVESIFALPGLGQLFYQAVMARDYPLILGNLVLGAILTLIGNFLADVGYTLVDPRTRK
ncbi:peptide/nickel transport system permease protein [Desulfonauticus submarinus]|uniref:Peptide/nickel transport system permease protein n=1 Tax=Desulfonauticus submarinus TaxID=206665 RepID=A0A1H0D6D5_9BACT|nr:ABC transporter permease [Desulfonauticus submarinus]SDN65734.1 peptide/nickel transport system permease protein [Desulfonauticus submarinus]